MSKPISDEVKTYLKTIGAKGGRKSRRKLDPAQARRMVAVREARRAFCQYHPAIFWSAPKNLVVHEALVPYVIDELRREGNREAFLKAGRIQRLWKAGNGLCR
jgi:hypothetical protein